MNTEPSGGIKPRSPKPLKSLTASAARLRSTQLKGIRHRAVGAEWQSDAWDLYEQVGEQRFLSNTLANRMSQAYMYIGTLEDDLDDPVATQDEKLIRVLAGVGHNAAGLSQIIQRLGLNLFIAGEAWLAGIPREYLPEHLREIPAPSGRDNPAPDYGLDSTYDPDDIDISDLEWRMFSVDEVETSLEGLVTFTLGAGDDEKITANPDDIYMIRIWRPHPRRSWEADSPTRSSLPVLRELAGLTMHISAQVDSRLAGAGVFIVPQSADQAFKEQQGDDDEGDFSDALMDVMITPISDRGSASAVVPLVLTVPDAATDKFRHITFAGPLDAEARELRNEAIHRLAIGQDAPPELLLGTSGMNHWGAWLVNEDTVTTHLEPPLALICDALTTQYLWPVMRALGYPDEEIKKHVVWYSVEHMIVRPNRGRDAISLYEKGELSGTTLRETLGFGEDDKPAETSTMPPAAAIAVEMIQQAPSLATDPGLPKLIADIQAAIDGETPPASADDSEEEREETIEVPAGVEPSENTPGGDSDSPDAPPSIPETDDAPAPSEVVG